jgi:hypothetical protein
MANIPNRCCGKKPQRSTYPVEGGTKYATTLRCSGGCGELETATGEINEAIESIEARAFQLWQELRA